MARQSISGSRGIAGPGSGCFGPQRRALGDRGPSASASHGNRNPCLPRSSRCSSSAEKVTSRRSESRRHGRNHTHVRSTLTGASAATTVVFDPKFFASVSRPGSNVGPLVSTITNTELAAAEFVPTLLALTETSSNASIVSQLSVFDSTTNTITTTGFYNLLSVGPVFATYRLDGTFSNLSDLDTEHSTDHCRFDSVQRANRDSGPRARHPPPPPRLQPRRIGWIRVETAAQRVVAFRRE